MKGKASIIPAGKAIVLFDGWCNLCSALVNFALKRDKQKRLLFGALQESAAKRYLRLCHLPLTYRPSIVLVEQDRCHLKSGAVLRILRILGLPWSLLYVFILVPRFIRDPAYILVARLRYRVFGRRENPLYSTGQ